LAWSASVAVANSPLNGISIIGHTVTILVSYLLPKVRVWENVPYSAVVLDIAEDLVGCVRVEGRNTLVSDVLQPVWLTSIGSRVGARDLGLYSNSHLGTIVLDCVTVLVFDPTSLFLDFVRFVGRKSSGRKEREESKETHGEQRARAKERTHLVEGDAQVLTATR
jgi:hypothetical protein